MLSTLIYKSHATHELSAHDIDALIEDARKNNNTHGLTGILLYDGTYFFQMIEGHQADVERTFSRIVRDNRHTNIIKILDDYAPSRRFSGNAMRIIDTRRFLNDNIRDIMSETLGIGPDQWHFDRALRVLNRAARGDWLREASDTYCPDQWTLVRRSPPFSQVTDWRADSAPCQFAFQPIVDTRKGVISSLEALMRSGTGGPPDECFHAVSAADHHIFDLQSKKCALALAQQIGLGDCSLAINLLPMSLVDLPNAVDFLAEEISAHDFSPNQIIVEITEVEAISDFDTFYEAIKILRSRGIRIAIDDFGSGFAGLSLLSKIQPDQIKIDRSLIDGISSDGPRQCIVTSILHFSRNLCISVVAEGVESMEDWYWLQSAGIDLYQGYLFAKPFLRGVSDINWPEHIN